MKGEFMTTINPTICTNHNPICPNCGQGCNHPQQPIANNYSGVSIDIHNPAVNIPPYNPIYEIPQSTLYGEQPSVEEVK